MEPLLLIASPQMHNRLFERTVVLLYRHNPEGALGVVINRPIEESLSDVVEMDSFDLAPYAHVQVVWGGPVHGSGTVVTTGSLTDEEGRSLPGGLGVTQRRDALIRLLEEGDRLILCLGHAGWGEGQLDREIEEGSWLCTDVDKALVFDVPANERYDRALATLGLTSTTVWMQPINE